MSNVSSHIPVLVKEVIAGLNLRSGDNVIDATVGGGGHAEAIFEAISPNGKLLGIDWDKRAIELAKQRLGKLGLDSLPAFAGTKGRGNDKSNKNRIILKTANYTELPSIVRELNFAPVNGILLDLGLSSDQLADSSRGFSFTSDGPFNMRFSDQLLTNAYDIVNTYSEERLASIFREYGEERHAARIARLIVASRRRAPLSTPKELAELVRRGVGRRGDRIHPATRIFQALRLAVNSELENIAKALPSLVEILSPGGRIAVITFHSLEDRLVKRFFKDMDSRPRFREGGPYRGNDRKKSGPGLSLINKHVIKPSREEISSNPRSRSAKLRIAEKRTTPHTTPSPSSWRRG